ncbi:cysteine hydrolase [Amycolatopsis acidiphila]|uniref:Cysteine hydrolase n=1 Tax=Amycolatopsis acidiphila TaxID=715473 RepID=A0A557ZXQ1_9PSEU|nr:isochorismatase family cysteine hydrolase [Amycolatopsis acidiphila]TVT16799.1 cysteine hydrolase [Amycolatopsis acidiphila]UIJ57054.1 cysteine hydrolase [Amycolatopsis acidiphila]GHG53623.1 hydrolase [Amycolatopsis acidiphila]
MTNSALLVMDVQAGIVSRFDQDSDYLPGLRRAIGAARAAGVPVIYVQVGFRAGYPEISSHNKGFGAIRDRGGFDEAAMRIHPDVTPLPGEVVVTKRRVSAFAGSDLDVVLRAGEVRELVLTGIATSGVVLSTLRQAADLDFRLTVLSDGCLDADAEVHRVLTEKVFPRQAEVTTIDAWAKGL